MLTSTDGEPNNSQIKRMKIKTKSNLSAMEIFLTGVTARVGPFFL